jgi:hypothetical protein
MKKNEIDMINLLVWAMFFLLVFIAIDSFCGWNIIENILK